MITVKTNIKTVISSLKEKIAGFEPGGVHYDGLLRTVATSMIGVVKTRIHEEGKAADGSDIGQYNSTDPLYVNPKDSPVAFQPAGKREVTYNVKTKKASLSTIRRTEVFDIGSRKSKKVSIKDNHRERSSKWFASYKNFRSEIGRRSDKVNLSLSGQLNSQLTVQPTNQGYGYGWPDEEKLKRAGHLEKKYKKRIWALTEEEKAEVVVISQKYVHNAISE